MTTTRGGDGKVGRAEELFEELVREHGQKGAAARLGVGYQTVRRSLKAGRPSPRLRSALEYHILRRDRGERSVSMASDTKIGQEEVTVSDVDDLNDTQDASGIAVLGKVNPRDPNHAERESEFSELPLRKLVAFLALKVERIERNLNSARSDGTDQGSPAVPSVREVGSGEPATPGKSEAAGEAVVGGGKPTPPRETSDGRPIPRRSNAFRHRKMFDPLRYRKKSCWRNGGMRESSKARRGQSLSGPSPESAPCKSRWRSSGSATRQSRCETPGTRSNGTGSGSGVGAL